MVFKKLAKNMNTCLILFSVTIGVLCLILVFAINEGGKREIVKTIKEKGDVFSVVLNPYIWISKEKRDGTLSFNDLNLIKRSCPEVKEICFISAVSFNEMRIGNKQYKQEYFSAFPTICGTLPDWMKVKNMRLKEGRFINKTDLQYKRRICVLAGEIPRFLGKNVLLYRGEIPIGVVDGITPKAKDLIGKKLITKNPDGEFTIVGILEKKMPLFTSLPEEMANRMVSQEISEDGTVPNQDKPDIKSILEKSRKGDALETNYDIYIPFSTWQDFSKDINISKISMGGISLQNKILNGHLFSSSTLPPRTFIHLLLDISFEKGDKWKFIVDKEIAKIFGKFAEEHIPEILEKPLNKIRKVLRKRYGEDKCFFLRYSGSLIDELRDEIEDSNKLLGIVLLSSLLFSGINLSSIMLLSVHKRVGEIGICRAFGAKKKDIFQQFLTEGVAIYSVGIIIGLVIGMVLSYVVIVKMLSWEYFIPWYALVLSSLLPLLVGIISSLYPAMKAANIPPAIAVKYE